MNISEAARLTGLSSKAIRFYEEKGLFTAPARSANGYRDYQTSHIEELRLIKQAKAAGFSLEECKALIGLHNNPQRRSADIKARTLQKIEQLEKQIVEMQAMRDTLVALAKRCPGDETASCPIMQQWVTGGAS